MALDAGSRIAQYRLERKIGAGGMGEVYLARDEKLGRLVAIKLLSAADDGARRRLAREARAAASLDHPGICQVYEVGSDPAVGDFIAMQYIEGETLAARLRRGKMSPDEAMNIGAQIAEALVAAHKHGLVHRDLKPQNIIITPQGSARLLDFGLALHVPTTVEAANAITSSRVTDPNMVLGTPSYMSPEQVRNEPADFRSDVFSLGCVLYECLTGTRAFNGHTTAEVLGAILHIDPPPVSSVAPGIGPAYDATCARMMDKIPSERFQSAEEALGAIRALMPSRPMPSRSRTVKAPPRSRRLVAAVAVALVAVAGWAVWQWQRPRALPTPPADAAAWYARGVDALRDGAFVSARDAFKQATALFSDYALAYARLAEANTGMEDEQAAQRASGEALRLVPNRLRLTKEDRLRFEGASAASYRRYAAAIDAYRQLAELNPRDAGSWVDLGRTLEASPITPRPEALRSYEKALALDSQNASARLRLGVLQAGGGKVKEGLQSMDDAISLYRIAARGEGEAEAVLRKGIAQANQNREEARRQFREVLRLTETNRYPAQRIRAQFELARLSYFDGLYENAEQLARQGVAEATNVGLRPLAATGLIDVGIAVMGRGLYPEADAQFNAAIAMAQDSGAKRVEMRAKLQRASLSVTRDRPTEALEIAEEPIAHFSKTEDARILAAGKGVLSRAHESLEHYAEARRLAEDVLKFVETSQDPRLLTDALENVAGQLKRLGNFPQAVTYRQRLDDLHQSTPSALAKDLANHAELLILLGRVADAEALLKQIDAGIAAGTPAFAERRARVAQLRALLAATQRRWPDVIAAVAAMERAVAEDAKARPAGAAPIKPGDSEVFGRLLAEHARAQLRQSKMSTRDIAAWPASAADVVNRREWAFWASQILILRGEPALAQPLLTAALAAPGIADNPEQGWRLAAVAKIVAQRLPSKGAIVAEPAQRNTTPEDLEKAWGAADAAVYFSRPDLTVLRKEAR